MYTPVCLGVKFYSEVCKNGAKKGVNYECKMYTVHLVEIFIGTTGNDSWKSLKKDLYRLVCKIHL